MRTESRYALFRTGQGRPRKFYLTLPAKAAIPHPAMTAINSEITAL
jgi:hypothetical protein